MKHLVFLLMTLSLAASPVKVHESRSFADLKGGELNGTGLSGDGIITMMPALKLVSDLNESYIWDACTIGGNIFVAAGEKGKIYRIVPGAGAPRLLTYFDEGTVYALAPFNGKLYVGLSPSGIVYEVDPDSGKQSEAFKTESDYIWRMVSTEQFLYIATGLPGTVQRVDRNMFRKTLASDLDNHVEALLVEGNRILAGTHPDGRILEIHAERQPYLMVDTPFAEVRDLALINGTLMAACFNGTPENNNKNEKVKPAREVADQAPVQGGLITVNQQGVPHTVARFNDMAPLTILADREQFLVGTGHSGKLVHANTDQVFTIAGEVDCGQITRFFRLGGAPHFCTANPGRIYRIQTGYELKGTYTAVPIVHPSPVNWGRIYFDADTPTGSRVEFHVRGGNSGSPDATWSPWKKVENGSQTGLQASTGLQWRATLISQDPRSTPAVSGMQLYCRLVNLPPRITAVETLPPGVWVEKEARKTDAVVIPTRSAEAMEAVTPEEGNQVGYMPGIQSVRILAEDPNGDTLQFDIDAVSESGKRFPLVARKESSIISFHTARLPEGTYRFRVTVSDRLENSSSDRTDTMDGYRFQVDRSAPTIQLSAAADTIDARIQDDRSIIDKVAYSTDGGKTWQPVWPEDQVPDSGQERYRIPLNDNNPVIIRATDDHGNTRTALWEGR